MKGANNTIRVWDPLVRIGHWALAIAFAIAWLSGDESSRTHVWAGYTIAAIVATRVLWGLVGSRNARFTQFVRSPAAALRYVTGLLTGRAKRYTGHNPAGGLMVVALLASLAVTGISGMAVYAIEEGAGPLAGWVAPDGAAATDRYDDDDREHGENEALEEAWEEVHEIAANLTLLLVVLHIAGVAASSIAHRENLVGAMITGRKHTEAPHGD